MPAVYQTPGVYYERADASAPAISAVRTDIAGFVGIALRGPVDTPLPVESWRQFEAQFGGFTGSGFLAYAVRGFFENGGARCWVVRVASKDPSGGCHDAGAVFRSATRDVWRIRASSPGVWGNNLTVRVIETHRAQTLSIPTKSTPEAACVGSVSGFGRATQVRISQPGRPSAIRVISDVDAIESLLYWVHPSPESRLAYDQPLTGFDPDAPVLIESIEYTLSVQQALIPILVREGLSLIREHPSYGPLALGPLVLPDDLDARQLLPPAPAPVVIEELREPDTNLDALDLPDADVRLSGGADGLALLTTYAFTGEPVSPTDSDEVRGQKQRGLQAFDRVGEISIIAIPDIHIRPIPPRPKAPPPACIPDPCLPSPAPAVTFQEDFSLELPPVFSEDDVYRVQSAMILHCELRRDRVAIIEAPFRAAHDERTGPAAVRAWRQRFDSRYAALYYPWVRVVDPFRDRAGEVRDIPPSGHVAGQYARTDFTIGVHKAPANYPLEWLQDVTAAVNDELHGVLNSAGINLLKAVPGRRIRIMGARTVSSDTAWRFINVRRLMLMIEKSIDISLQWAAFEPNDLLTRAKIRLVLSSFLIALWERGALMGGDAESAFFVKCDDENNPPSERDQGRLNAEVGVAPSQPFEFVIVRIGRAGNRFELAESDSAFGGG